MVSDAFIAEAKSYGWDVNKDTGIWSGNCNVCGEYKEIPEENCVCQDCIDDGELNITKLYR
jgi:hypothetical protein